MGKFKEEDKKHKLGKEKERFTRDEFEIVSLIIAEQPHLRKRVVEHLEAARIRMAKKEGNGQGGVSD